MKKGKLRIFDGGSVAFYCQGCKKYHEVIIDKGKPVHWGFNENYDLPTFTPSVLVTIGHYPEPNEICHSFVTNGKIQYLNDCTHELCGQTVDMTE